MTFVGLAPVFAIGPVVNRTKLGFFWGMFLPHRQSVTWAANSGVAGKIYRMIVITRHSAGSFSVANGLIEFRSVIRRVEPPRACMGRAARLMTAQIAVSLAGSGASGGPGLLLNENCRLPCNCITSAGQSSRPGAEDTRAILQPPLRQSG